MTESLSEIVASKLKQIKSEQSLYEAQVKENIDKLKAEKDQILQAIEAKKTSLEERMEHINLESEIDKIKGQILQLAPKKFAKIDSEMLSEVPKIPPLPDNPDVMGAIKSALKLSEPPEILQITPLPELPKDKQKSWVRKWSSPSSGVLEQQAKKALQDEMDKLKQAKDVVNKALDDMKSKNEENANTKLAKLTVDMFDEFELQYQSSKNGLSQSSDIIRKNVGGK